MIGCDKFCTYCIVPSVRGPEQSRHPEQIAAEVRQLAGEGVREITLLGQTVNSYHHGTSHLSNLLARIHDTAGIERIKFITNFPKDMSDDLLHAVRDLPKVCPYLHVPAQSGCNEILKRMKRMYTVEFYRDMLARCHEIVPGVAISSDFIVGFSGETEESFERTCDLVREAKFKNSFIFKYSPRRGTRGHELYEDDVPEDVKKRRNNDLLMIQNAASLQDHRRQIGQRVEVLVEGPSKNAFSRSPLANEVLQLTGRTRTDHIVVFDGNPRLAGQTMQIDIDDATSFTLYGNVVTGEQIGVAKECCEMPTENRARIALPLIG
jgi:tRNA-2-methylthio-N6-dimethylallyladenosine synthase